MGKNLQLQCQRAVHNYVFDFVFQPLLKECGTGIILGNKKSLKLKSCHTFTRTGFFSSKLNIQ